jgi:hypothetical protein
MLISRFVVYITITASLTGCTGMKTAHLRDKSNQDQMAHKDEREKLWQDNKGWLLSKLPKTEPLVRDVLSASEGNPEAKYSCSDLSDVGCNKMFYLMRQKMSPYDLVLLPDGFGSFALIDGDYAYVFRMTDWTFSGIANLTTAIYFTVPDVPLRRTDERSFAFVDDNKTDTETVWTMYRRNIMDKGRSALTLGEYTLTRAELDAAGVPKQIDHLTPQLRSERELAKQGLVWRRRAQRKAIMICSSKSEPGNGARKPDGRGGKGKHNRTAPSESTTTGSTPASATTISEALQGKAHLNCNTGSGSVVTEDGIAAEVYRLIKNKEGFDAIIAATAKEIPGGVIQYKYTGGQEGIGIMNLDASRDMILQFETMDGNSKLNLNLRADTGVSTGSLTLVGNWNLGSGYHISDKDISKNELATLFIRAYRDCAMRNSEGICKNIPDLFMSLQNPLIAVEFIHYISDHYLSDAEKGR